MRQSSGRHEYQPHKDFCRLCGHSKYTIVATGAKCPGALGYALTSTRREGR